MDRRSLKTFINLAETLHFGKTAQMSNMTTSSLSRMIQRLEEEVGSTLFDRTNREVHITNAGRGFYDFAVKTLEEFDNLQLSLHENDPKMIKGTIKLYATVTAAYNILPSIFKGFKDNYPNITIWLETGLLKQGFRMLQDGEMDFTIGIMNQRNISKFMCQKITQTPLVFVIRKDSVFNDLETYPLIISRAGDLVEIVMDYFDRQNIRPNISTYVEGHEAILAMVAGGLGGAILPQIVVEHSHLADSVKIVNLEQAFSNKIEKNLPMLEVGIFMKKTQNISKIKQIFWEFVGGVFG